MAQVAFPNQAKANHVMARSIATNPAAGGVPYTLRAGAASSDGYHSAISALADEWLLHAQEVAGDLVEDYRSFRRAAGDADRSFAECAFEFLTLGVLLREHGAEAAALPHWLAWTLGGLSELQGRAAWAKPAIKPLQGLLLGIERLLRRPYREHHDVRRLVAWLRAHDERAQADRLSEWQPFFDALEGQRTEAAILQSLVLADDFARQSAARLGPYTEGVGDFVVDAAPRCGWRHDRSLVLSSRLEYHLGMLGTEILSRAYRDAFLACQRRVVVLPDCMRRRQDGRCQAVRTPLGGQCRHCAMTCRVHQITEMGEANGFEVYILPDELRDLGVQACSAAGRMGVVGVSCALTNWHGGWQLQAAGVPAQGVLLDYAGCRRHWHERGLPTDVNVNKLQEVVGKWRHDDDDQDET